MNLIPFSPPPSKPPTVNTLAPPTRTALTQSQIDAALKICLALQIDGVKVHSKRPFAALLLAPDNNSVLLTHLSISHVQHAEAELARLASIHYNQEYLGACTLVSTWEPCAMCTGTLYWSNIGRLLYAASEDELNKLTGKGNGENMTMSLPCRNVLKHGQKDIEVLGPIREGGWEKKVVHESGKWWREHNKREEDETRRVEDERRSVNTESMYSVQNEDGEYEANLQIDWLT